MVFSMPVCLFRKNFVLISQAKVPLIHRALVSMFSMLNQCVHNVLTHNQHKDFTLSKKVVEKYMTKSLVLAVLWSFAGDCELKCRVELGHFIGQSTSVQMPSEAHIPSDAISVIDYEVCNKTIGLTKR